MEKSSAFELNPEERAEVRHRYPNTYFPDPVLEPIWYGRREHVRITEKKAIIDQKSENHTVFGICSDQYKIVPYEDIVSLVEKTVKTITDFGKIEVSPMPYLHGARIKIGLRFPDCPAIIKEKDTIVPKIEVFSSYDLSTKLLGRFGAFQLKCLNGMGVWKTLKTFAKRHLQNLFVEELGQNITEGLAGFGTQIDQWKDWAKTKIPMKTYEEIWTSLPFSSIEKEKIEALPEIGSGLLLSQAIKSKDLDLWSLNSVLTQYATHEVKSELRRIDLEPTIAEVMGRTFDKLH